MSYFTLLLLLHVAGAIIGFGPAFSFAVLGPMAGKLGGPEGLGILKGILNVQKTFLIPMIIVQPLTGALLIFKEGLDDNFFDHWWLWVSILLFAANSYIGLFVQRPAVQRLVDLAQSGQAGTPEFMANAKKTKTYGPILTIMLVVIIYLMVVKPGG